MVQRFASCNKGAWAKYIAWSGLGHLDEVVSLDPMLCPTVLPEIIDEYWPHIVNEDFMLNFFIDLEFLLKQVPDIRRRNLLCVYRNPESPPPPYEGTVEFEFLGYDLVDVEGSVSALTAAAFPTCLRTTHSLPRVCALGHVRSTALLMRRSQCKMRLQSRGRSRGRHILSLASGPNHGWST